jgi:hypothetical protein
MPGISLAVVVYLITPSQLIIGQLEGDRELLKQTAVCAKQNVETILTWQGDAKRVIHYKGTQGGNVVDFQRFCDISFAYDRVAKKLMFSLTQTRETGVRDGRPYEDHERVRWGGIRSPEGFSESMLWYPDRQSGPQSRPVFLLLPHNKEVKSVHSRHFDPLLYLKVDRFDVHDRLMAYYEAAPTLKFDRALVRSGSRIILTFKLPGLFTHYEFDLDQGGMPVRVENAGDASTVKLTCKCEQVGAGTWLPRHAHVHYANHQTKEIQELTTDWTRHTLNETIPPSAFQPEAIGIGHGDVVRDRRTGVEYLYERSGIASVGDPERQYWWIVFGLAAVAVAVIVGAWYIRARRARRLVSAQQA